MIRHIFILILCTQCCFTAKEKLEQQLKNAGEAMVKSAEAVLKNVTMKKAVPDEITDELRPFVNSTAWINAKRKQDREHVITDEDVADIPDEEHINQPIYDGEKTTIKVTSEAGVALYQHWLDQAVSGLMSAVATKKLSQVAPISRRDHHICAKKAKTVSQHAACVAALLEVPERNQTTTNKNQTTTIKHRSTSGGRKRVGLVPRLNYLLQPRNKKTHARTSGHKKSRKSPKKSDQERKKLLLNRQLNKVKELLRKDSRTRHPKRLNLKKKTKNNKKHMRKHDSQKMLVPKRIQMHQTNRKLKLVPKRNTVPEFRRRIRRDLSAEYDSVMRLKKVPGRFNEDIMREVMQEKRKERIRKERKNRKKEHFFKMPKVDIDHSALLHGSKPVSRSSYTLKDEKSGAMFGSIAKTLTKAVRAMKHKDPVGKSWKETLLEIKQEGKALKKRTKSKRLLKKRFEMFTQTMDDLGIDGKGAMETMGLDFYEDKRPLTSREEMLEDMKDIEKKMTPEQKLLRKPLLLLRDGVKLGMKLAGQDTSDFENKTLKIVSPKIMALMPDEDRDESVSLISPSLFSLHTEGGKNEILSLGKMMSDLDHDEYGHSHQDWLNFIMEASGVSDAVKEVREKRLKDEAEEEQTPNHFTKENITRMFGDKEGKKVEIFEALQKTLTEEQMRTLNDTGYVQMTSSQLEMIYGPASPYEDTEAFDRLSNVSAESIPTAISNTINALAKEQLAFKARREKDIVLSPLVLSPIISDPVTVSQALILSPVLFSPLVFSPAVFGTVVLSPWLFVPVILSPRVLGPVVLSPFLFSPVILSPLALTPLILSPGVANPFILSPFVLAPFILSPVALTPVILSPFALSPFIGVANLMSPLILSPFVLSPLIWSPAFVSAFVLSPYALSPVIESNGKFFTSVLSPSWMS